MYTMFGKTAFTSLPDEILKSKNDGLAHYLAGIWHEFFQEYRLIDQDTVVEIAPGCYQYPSLTLKQNGIHFLNNCAIAVLEELKRRYCIRLVPLENIQRLLNKQENYNDFHLGSEVLHAKNWMILQMIKH